MPIFELTVLIDAPSVEAAETVRQAIRTEFGSRSWSQHEDVAFCWLSSDDGLFEFTILTRIRDAELAGRLRQGLVNCLEACRAGGTLPKSDVVFGQFAEKPDAYDRCGDCQAPVGEQHRPTCGLGRGDVRMAHTL